MSDNRLIQVIDLLMAKVESYLRKDEAGMLRYVDPNDGMEITAHYGVSHLIASMILLGHFNGDSRITSVGYELLRTMLSEIKDAQKLPAYHYDFNNFALALVLDYISDSKVRTLVETALMEAPDSVHDTINWLPMRIFVNRKRYEISGNIRYLEKINTCKDKISKATNQDGSIEDRLPKGTSFNLQYDISTVALLQFISNTEDEYDIAKSIGFLIQCIAPDGDINYQGRGTNQIFAWGPWIYLLSHLKDKSYLDKALNFLVPRIKDMLGKDSMMLNKYNGSEHHLWWDYHYASVYISHCLLWFILAEISSNNEIIPNFIPMSDSGMKIFREGDTSVAVFNGRNEYLAEHGPAISAIYIKGIPIVKGCFGPWRGLFGNKHSVENVAIFNSCGLYETNKPKTNLISRIINHLHIPLEKNTLFSIKPVFVPLEVKVSYNEISITWVNKRGNNAFFNIPAIEPGVCFSLTVDGNNVPLNDNIKLRNQYDWVTLYQSHSIIGQTWTLTISI